MSSDSDILTVMSVPPTQPAGLLGALNLACPVHTAALVLTRVLLTALTHLEVHPVGGGRTGDQVLVGLGRAGQGRGENGLESTKSSTTSTTVCLVHSAKGM